MVQAAGRLYPAAFLLCVGRFSGCQLFIPLRVVNYCEETHHLHSGLYRASQKREISIAINIDVPEQA